MPRQVEVKVPSHDAKGIEHSDLGAVVPEKKVIHKPHLTEREYLHQLWREQAKKRAAEKKLLAQQRQEANVRQQYGLSPQALKTDYSAQLWARPDGARASCRIAQKRQKGVTAAQALVNLSGGACDEGGAASIEEGPMKKQNIQHGSVENQYGSLWDPSKLPPPKQKYVSPKQRQKQVEKQLEKQMQKFDTKYMTQKKEPEPPTWEENYERTVRFKERCKMFPMAGQLYNWLEEQKKDVDNLSDEQRKMLEELGVFGGSTEGTNPQKNWYWESAEAAKLFGCEYGVDDVQTKLRERVKLLKNVNKTPNGWKTVIPSDGYEDKYTDHDIMHLRHKAQYLVKTYLIALKEMNKKTFLDCCDMASKDLVELGLIKAVRTTIQKYNMEFRQNHVFAHPRRVTAEPRKAQIAKDIFYYFPQAKDRFIEIATINKHQLTGKFMANEMNRTIVPELERQSRENNCFDDGSPGQDMLVKLLANPFSFARALNYMNKFNIEWDRTCTRRGRGGTSVISQSMKEAWATGKFSNRRPKGQGGLKRTREDGEGGVESGSEEVDEHEDVELHEN